MYQDEIYDSYPLDFYAETNGRWIGNIKIYSRGVLGNLVVYPERIKIRERHTKEEVISGDDIDEPLLVLSRESAEKLMDALWRAGIRPSGGVQAAHEAIEILSNMLIAAKEKSEA